MHEPDGLSAELRRLAQRLDADSRTVSPADAMERVAPALAPGSRRGLLPAIGVAAVVAALVAAVSLNGDDHHPVDTVDSPTTEAPGTTATSSPSDFRSNRVSFEVPLEDWPTEGIAVRERRQVVFLAESGDVLGQVEGELMSLLTSTPSPETITVTDEATFAVETPDEAEAPPGCDGATTVASLQVALCGGQPQRRTQIVRVAPDGGTTVLAEGAPGSQGAGHWRWAIPSPDGQWVLAQWSGECEVPVAFVIAVDGSSLRTVDGQSEMGEGTLESQSAGWTTDGQAIVTFSAGACGSGIEEPGTYLIDPVSLEPTLLRADPEGFSQPHKWRRDTTAQPPQDPAGPQDLQPPEAGREITFDGAGAMRIDQVLDPSAVRHEGGGSCGYWGPSEPADDGDERLQGLASIDDPAAPRVVSVMVWRNSTYRTASGVGIGTTLETLERIYGDDLVVDRFDGWEHPTDGLLASYYDVAAVRNGDRALTFYLMGDVVSTVKVSHSDFWGDDEGCA